jgi:hypothetical protein
LLGDVRKMVSDAKAREAVQSAQAGATQQGVNK